MTVKCSFYLTSLSWHQILLEDDKSRFYVQICAVLWVITTNNVKQIKTILGLQNYTFLRGFDTT